MAKVTVLMSDGRLKTMDDRFARVLVMCKKAIYASDYQTKVIKSKPAVQDAQDELQNLREMYKLKFAKRAFHGWGVDELKMKLAEQQTVPSPLAVPSPVLPE